MPRSPSKPAATPSSADKRVTRGSTGIKRPSALKSPVSKLQPETPAARGRSRSANTKKVSSPKKTASPSPKSSRSGKGVSTPKKAAQRGRSAGRQGKKSDEVASTGQKRDRKVTQSPAKTNSRSKSRGKPESPKASVKKGRPSKSPVKTKTAQRSPSTKRKSPSKKVKSGEEQKVENNLETDEKESEDEQEAVEKTESEGVEEAQDSSMNTPTSASKKRKRNQDDDRSSDSERSVKIQKVSKETDEIVNDTKVNTVEPPEGEVLTSECDKQETAPEVTFDTNSAAADEPQRIETTGGGSVVDRSKVVDSNTKDDEFEIISKDDVPPADSDEIVNIAEKMVPPPPAVISAADDGCSKENGCGGSDVLLSRQFVANSELSSVHSSSRSFTVVSYNVLADVHAQKDYARAAASWIASEHLAIDYRHKLLMKEIKHLDGDIVCLQEVEGSHMKDLLSPDMEALGYKGIFIPRHTEAYCEGEATFYRSSRFSVVSSRTLILQDVTNEAVDLSSLDADTKEKIKKALSTHAVAVLVRLKAVDAEDEVTVANIHVAYDNLERPDRRCVQLAQTIQKVVELAGGTDKPHVICGDFNSQPTTAPYHFVRSGHLNMDCFKELQSVKAIEQEDSEPTPVVNVWPDGFQFPAGGDLKSAYATVLGTEPLTSRFASTGNVLGVDYIWFSSVSLDLMGVLKVVEPELIQPGVPSSVFPSDHVSLKAQLVFK